jgi:hypothetical protein
MTVTMTLEIETESAGAYADASEADLHRLVSLMNEDNSYVILHRYADDDAEQFAQAALARDADASFTGQYVVEYKLKSGTLRQATVASTERVYELLSGWAFDRPGWKRGETWTSVDLEWVIDIIGNCEVEERGGEVVVRFPLFDIEGTGATKAEAYASMMDKERALVSGSMENWQRFSDWAKDHLIKQPRVKEPR